MREGKAGIACLGFIALLLAGCDNKSEIKVYRVSKAPLEESAASQGQGMPTNAGSPAAPMGTGSEATALTVAVPPNWEPQPLSQMRQGSFLVKGDHDAVTDISFVSLGAAAGNVLENVNRWLDQLGQPPVTEEKLGQLAQRVPTSLGEATVIDIAGLPKGGDANKDGRIVAAMVTVPNATMFFKMRGNDALTESQKAEFIKWVVAVCNAQAGAIAPASAPTAAAPAPAAASAPRDAATPKLKWKLPPGWQEVPASAMRYASFTTADTANGKIDISIVTFPGDGGSDADNVNRWRRQIGLGPADEKAMTTLIVPLNTPAGTFSTVDMTSGNSQMLAAWLRREGQSWFFKMNGPAASVEREKSNFSDFIRSIQFGS